MKLTRFEAAAVEVDEKFKERGIVLLEFSGKEKSCVIKCPKHGEQTIARFSNMLKSPYGCKQCGKEAQAAAIRKNPLEPNTEPGPSLHLRMSNGSLPEDEYVFVPFYKDVTFAGGSEDFRQENYNGYLLPFGKSTLKRYGVPCEKAACFTVRGDSMEPAMPDGASIGVNQSSKNIRDGKVYAFVQEGLFRVKVLHRLPGGEVRIRSFNSDAHPDEMVSEATLDIVGHVFWWSALNI